jgi:thymidylate synthase (FAD)
MSDYVKPIVRVIAATQFFGVPEELLANGRGDGQDEGSDGARLIECAGRTCYDSYNRGRGSDRYHENIKTIGHGSVTEHVSISFFISGVSRGLTHELVRHRTGVAISQRSTRYVDESKSPWILHPLIHKHCSGRLLFAISKLIDHSRDIYQNVIDEIERDIGKEFRKQARGAARGLLGNALETELTWTANVRALRHFLEMRAAPTADAEIRLLANALYEAALEKVPEYFNDYKRVECPDGVGYGLETSFRKI